MRDLIFTVAKGDSIAPVTEAQRKTFTNNQKELCVRTGAPFFMFEKCPTCRCDVLQRLIQRGEDGTVLVTGCPSCLRSWCD